MTAEQKKQFEQALWGIANDLRGHMNADEFRDYILGFIFYKYLSEQLELHVNTILADDDRTFDSLDETSADDAAILAEVEEDCLENLGYFLKHAELFGTLTTKGAVPGNFILDDLTEVLINIQKSTSGTASEDDFDNLFEDMDLTSTKLGRTNQARNDLIVKVLVRLKGIDFRIEDTESDLLGDAYEYMIGKFASGAGKSAGEFYTPQQVSTILARIVSLGKSKLRSAYDPTCGSGSLLLRVKKEVGEVGNFFGQEMNRTTYNLARMNMLLRGVHFRDFDIRQGNTLEAPQHKDMKFEAIVANPPFSAKWSANKIFESDDRFAQYGKLAPKSKADYGFIQHMLHHLDEDGTAAVVMPHGVLFRGAAEGAIRQFIVEQNWLDAVIGLPANIFYGTSIPSCILVFKKCRTAEDVLFIDASSCFEKGKNQNSLSVDNVERIVSAYASRAPEERFSHNASLAEIEENGFNLNIPRYVDTFEPEAEIDLGAVTADIKRIDDDMIEIDTQIRAFCAELGLEAPV
jgi:type I restriction enzyme M protein